jgi:hypothetical protein
MGSKSFIGELHIIKHFPKQRTYVFLKKKRISALQLVLNASSLAA